MEHRRLIRLSDFKVFKDVILGNAPLEVLSIFICCLLLMSKPEYGSYTLAILLVSILIGIIKNVIKKATITIMLDFNTEDKYTPAFKMNIFLLISAAVILFYSVVNFKVFNKFYFILPTLIIYGLFTFLVFKRHTKPNITYLNYRVVYIITNLILLGFSYSLTYAINCTYDFNGDHISKVKIIDKFVQNKIKRQRSGIERLTKAYYYAILDSSENTPYGAIHEISLEQYLKKSDSIEIEFHKGLFNASWVKTIDE